MNFPSKCRYREESFYALSELTVSCMPFKVFLLDGTHSDMYKRTTFERTKKRKAKAIYVWWTDLRKKGNKVIGKVCVQPRLGRSYTFWLKIYDRCHSECCDFQMMRQENVCNDIKIFNGESFCVWYYFSFYAFHQSMGGGLEIRWTNRWHFICCFVRFLIYYHQHQTELENYDGLDGDDLSIYLIKNGLIYVLA